MAFFVTFQKMDPVVILLADWINSEELDTKVL